MNILLEKSGRKIWNKHKILETSFTRLWIYLFSLKANICLHKIFNFSDSKDLFWLQVCETTNTNSQIPWGIQFTTFEWPELKALKAFAWISCRDNVLLRGWIFYDLLSRNPWNILVKRNIFNDRKSVMKRSLHSTDKTSQCSLKWKRKIKSPRSFSFSSLHCFRQIFLSCCKTNSRDVFARTWWKTRRKFIMEQAFTPRVKEFALGLCRLSLSLGKRKLSRNISSPN